MPTTRTRAAAHLAVAIVLLVALIGVGAGPSPALAQGSPVINEFVLNHTGTDTSEYVEIYGAPGTDLSSYSLLQIEGDSTSPGIIDSATPVGTTDASGFWQTGFLNNELENGTVTLLLVEGFSGAAGDDLDTDNDGVLDTTLWATLSDGVAVTDGGAGDRTYAMPVLTAGFDGESSTPGGASRIPDGQDADATGDWLRNDSDLAGIAGVVGTPDPGEALNTPGAPNQAVPTGPAAPSITTQPASQTIPTGQSAALSVAATGSAPLSYQWYEGIAPDASIPVGANSPSLTTPALSATTSYWVRVTNSLGSADSATATITVGAACAAADTPIGQIQGTGSASPIVGTPVTVQGVVIGDYEEPFGSSQIRGFYLQDAGDGNPATSDGLFVFTNGTNRVSLGEVVQVNGTVSEFQNQTQLSGQLVIESCGSTGSVTPVDVTLPLSSADYLERFEGMLVRFPQTLYVTEHFQLGRFGQVVLSSGGRLFQPTSIEPPGVQANALQAANDLNKIILDDDNNLQNPDPIIYGRGQQPLSAGNTLRGGDSVDNLTGVLVYSWAGNSASGNAYRVRAVGDLDPAIPTFVAANRRPTAPPWVGGSLKVSAYNVLNYFLTLDTTSGSGPCGPAGTLECRGAETTEEFQRQRAKLLQALEGLNADVLGLIELENTTGVDPVGDLVAGLNGLTAPGTFAAIDTGTIGTDAIKVGLIYRPAAVTPVGAFTILDSADDPRFLDNRNRPVLAQTFRENATGETFTVAVAHLKSKGSACSGDPDTGDGQGNCNLTRTAAAEALVDWLDATFGDPDFLILGDLNSYAQEDPIAAILAGPDGVAGTSDDYTNLIARFGGAETYSYVFDGQWGYLDHALASASLAGRVTGAAEWHINADEPNVLDYNTNFKSAGQIADLYAADQFRTSDHDPVLIGLSLDPANAPLQPAAYLPLVVR